MSENFDRSKFKGAKLSTLKETREEAKKNDVKLITSDYDGNGRVQFHQIEDGVNEFRIMPPHDPSKTGSYVPVRTTTLECDIPEIKEGKETGKVEKKNKKIFIATQHGNEELRKLGKDPIELYIKYFAEEASLIDDKEERQSFLAPVKGYRDTKSKKWMWGIMPSTNFACYALKNNNLGRLELWADWVKEMDKIVAKIEEEDPEISDTDPFADPDEGYPLQVIKEKAVDKDGKETGKYAYSIDRRNPKKRQSWDEFCEENRVTDAHLKELFEKESLYELYVDVYSKRDFDLAVNGLMNFDKKWKRNIFENEAFLKELKEIEEIVPEAKEKKDSDVDKMFDQKKNSTKEWPKPKCKNMLKAYIMDSYEGTAEEREYLEVLETLDLNTLREWCSIAEKGEELPNIDDKETSDDIEVPEGVDVVEENNDEEKELENLTSRRRRSI